MSGGYNHVRDQQNCGSQCWGFKAFATPNAPQLAKLTQFYARNGRGKTTLSSVLRAASMGRADVLHGRRTFGTDPTVVQVTLVYTNGSISFASGRWTPRPAPIEVFDAGFIAENLFAGESVGLSHDRKLFSVILGAAEYGSPVNKNTSLLQLKLLPHGSSWLRLHWPTIFRRIKVGKNFSRRCRL